MRAICQRKRQAQAIAAAAVPIAILGLTQIQSPTGPLALEILGCVAFLGLGLLGAAAHHAFALAFQDDLKLAEEALAAPSIEEQRQTFISDHGLTPREADVLVAVTQDERPLKQVAEELGISMRMVQRHLSSIYQKTDTQTRAGLTKALPST